ncbi:MAG: response regulator [Desulfobacteraceae bacterium]
MITDPPYKILIVDDNDDILSTFCEFFNPVEYSIQTAGNGLDALKKIKRDKKEFDVLITDLIMPGIGGVGLISIIKKEYPKMKIIAMTGWGDQPGSLASEAKADVVLFKPVDLFKIEKLLVQLLNGHVDKE